MASRPLFTHTDPDLLPILEELRQREPIFHTPAFGTDFEHIMAPNYWEVGASGRRYSRDFILQTLSETPTVDAASAGWQSTGHALRRLGPDTYLLTYTLRQAERLTRRATIWQSTAEGWRILYHQGTIVSKENEQDNLFPRSVTRLARQHPQKSRQKTLSSSSAMERSQQMTQNKQVKAKK